MTDHMNFWEALGRAQTHATQMRILDVARGGERFSPNQMATRLNEPLGNVSYHTKVLLNKGMIELVGTEPRRGAVEHFYKATATLFEMAPRVGPSEELALAALDDALFEAMAAGVNAEQLAERFRQLEAREAGEAVAA
jgi:DNA-binding transcriptional ArsR family regulator